MWHFVYLVTKTELIFEASINMRLSLPRKRLSYSNMQIPTKMVDFFNIKFSQNFSGVCYRHTKKRTGPRVYCREHLLVLIK